MSWLRDHFHEFVYPAFVAAEKKSTEIGAPFHIEASKHAPERLPTELKKLWTLCREHGIEWSYDVRVLNTHGGTSKYRETAKLHHRILRSSLESACAAMRRERCTRILLPGRDIYMLAPMCARRGIPFLFVPELSRPNSDRPSMRAFLERLGVDGRELLVDTGYSGTIPANLNKLFGCEFKYRFLSETDRNDPRDRFHSRPHQLFPNRQNARTEACETEYLAKYWKSGTTDPEGNIIQFLADKRSIQRAALLTAMLFRGIPFWKVSAPRAKGADIYSFPPNVGVFNGVGNVITTTNFTTAGVANFIIGANVTTGINPTPIGAAQALQALNAVPQATGGNRQFGPPVFPNAGLLPTPPVHPPPALPPPPAGAPIALLPPAPAVLPVPVAIPA